MNVVTTTKDKVQRILTELATVSVDRFGRLSVRHGSTRVFVEVAELGDDHAWVRVTAPVLLEVTPSPALYEYVAYNSDKYRWGTLELNKDDDGTVGLWMTYGLLGTFLDPAELELAVTLLAEAADESDDELKARFGGVRFHED